MLCRTDFNLESMFLKEMRGRARTELRATTKTRGFGTRKLSSEKNAAIPHLHVCLPAWFLAFFAYLHLELPFTFYYSLQVVF